MASKTRRAIWVVYRCAPRAINRFPKLLRNRLYLEISRTVADCVGGRTAVLSVRGAESASRQQVRHRHITT